MHPINEKRSVRGVLWRWNRIFRLMWKELTEQHYRELCEKCIKNLKKILREEDR